GSRQARHRRHLSELCDRLRCLEGKGATDRRQRPYALLHRPHAPVARSANRQRCRSLDSGTAVKRPRAIAGEKQVASVHRLIPITATERNRLTAAQPRCQVWKGKSIEASLARPISLARGSIEASQGPWDREARLSYC